MEKRDGSTDVHWIMYTSIWWYLRVLPVLHRPEVVYIIEKHAMCLKDYRIRSFLSNQYVHGDLCKHLGIDSSTDHPDRYSSIESIPKCLHKSPCACQILKNDLIL